jgi:hypothetical protein
LAGFEVATYGRFSGGRRGREIRMVPAKDTNNQQSYFAEGEWNMLGRFDFALVAGEGFEPSTFGL